MVIRNTPVWAVMSTYNSWNHVPNSASYYLLTEILRGQFGFKGYVYSDWGAIEMLKTFHRVAHDSEEAAMRAFTAGLDVEASSNCYPELVNLIRKGKLDEEVLNESVRRVLYAKFKWGFLKTRMANSMLNVRCTNKKAYDCRKRLRMNRLSY